MILIQLILIVLLLFIGTYFIRSRNSNRTRAYKKVSLLLFIPIAVVIVLFPDLSTDIAHFVGVGRGADLLLYGLTVVTIFQLFNSYIKDRESKKQLVVLARKIALLEASAVEKEKDRR